MDKLKQFTDKEWLEIFPELPEISAEKIKELSEDKSSLEKEIADYYKKYLNDKHQDIEFIEALLIEPLAIRIKQIDRDINRFARYIKLSLSGDVDEVSDKSVSQSDIQAAIDFPLSELVSRFINVRKVGSRYVALCPFHNEKTPSFTIYPNTNSYYCFGCNAGGDTINFVTKYLGIGFVEAVKNIIY